MKIFYAIALFFWRTALCFGQNAIAISHSPASCSYSMNTNDIWSSTCNPAGLSEIKKTAIGFYCQNHFLLNDLATQYFIIAFPISKNISSGVSLFHQGNTFFSSNHLSFAAAMKLSDRLQMGAQLFFQYYVQSELNALYSMYPEMGATYKINSKINASASLRNFSANFIRNTKTQEVQVLRIGVSYILDEKVKIHAQVYFENNNYPVAALSIDYKVNEKIMLYFQSSSSNQPFAIGLGCLLKSINIKIAFTYNALLGASPSSSFTL